MKKSIIFIVFLIIYTNNIIGCSINIDSLFNHHISSMNEYLLSVIDGYILPTGNSNNRILADITEKRIKTNYNDSTKFFINGDNADFLKMYEFINDFEWERDPYSHNIKISRKEVLMIKEWYMNNKMKLNCDKIEKVLYWQRSYYKIYLENSTDKNSFGQLYRDDVNNLKKLKTFIE